MRVLGISAFHRDSAAALLIDGVPVAAAQEERFSRIAFDHAFPSRAIRYCLTEGGVAGNELDRVVFYEKPMRKFERVLALNLRSFPRSSGSFARGLFLWLGDRLWIKNRLVADLGVEPSSIRFSEQLPSMAAYAFHSSPFDEAALLVVDDGAEWASTLLGHVEGDGPLRVLAEVALPDSLGLFASAITQFLGFAPGEDEEKVEALAAWGAPKFASELGALVHSVDGHFSIEQAPFRFLYESDRLYEPALEDLLGPPRFPGDALRMQAPETRDADVAASLQSVLEQHVLALAHELHRRQPSSNLCFTGALARNRKLNALLANEGPFERVHVPPAPGKAGGALGAALLCAEHEVARRANGVLAHPSLGEGIDDRAEAGAVELGREADALDRIAERLAAGDRVGWVHGRLEFGARSLANRVALADARGAEARGRLLGALQRSEPFLPVRVAVPAARAAEYFTLPEGCESALRRAHFRVPATDELRDAAPSAVHPDGTAWPQLVDDEATPELARLLDEHGKTSGAPLLLITDLALRGSPLVRSEAEAAELFERSELDCLVAGTRIYARTRSSSR